MCLQITLKMCFLISVGYIQPKKTNILSMISHRLVDKLKKSVPNMSNRIIIADIEQDFG
jgi:hypothetical protein